MSARVINGLRPEEMKAVVFDLDGTLIRSTIDFKRMNDTVAETLLAHGLPKEILDTKGRIDESIVHAYAYLRMNSHEGWIERLEMDLNRVTAEVELALVDSSLPVPGALDALDDLEERGLRTAILTRGSRVYTLRALKASGLEGRFHAIVCRDDHPLNEAKPNPLALHRVFEHLDIKNHECLFIGDHESDMLCARGAETAFAAVLTGTHKADRWDRLAPDVIMDSIADLPSVLAGRP